jgi:hypothetical protein
MQSSIIENVPVRELVYKLFADYFEDPWMRKDEDKGNFSVYICRIYTLLLREFRYIIAITYKDDVPTGTVTKLSQLAWVSLQTRILDREENMSPHYYQPRRFPGLDQPIRMVKEGEAEAMYDVANLPLTVSLIKYGDKKYSQTGSVCIALETYNTIITFKK